MGYPRTRTRQPPCHPAAFEYGLTLRSTRPSTACRPGRSTPRWAPQSTGCACEHPPDHLCRHSGSVPRQAAYAGERDDDERAWRPGHHARERGNLARGFNERLAVGDAGQRGRWLLHGRPKYGRVARHRLAARVRRSRNRRTTDATRRNMAGPIRLHQGLAHHRCGSVPSSLRVLSASGMDRLETRTRAALDGARTAPDMSKFPSDNDPAANRRLHRPGSACFTHATCGLAGDGPPSIGQPACPGPA